MREKIPYDSYILGAIVLMPFLCFAEMKIPHYEFAEKLLNRSAFVLNSLTSLNV